jgi:uncharacterized protein
MTIFADGKMRAIFSLTFGASVYLLIDRLSRRGAAADAADIDYRRTLWLLLFGLIHAYLIFSGDVLFPYAMMGLLLYPLRKLSPRTLLIAAAILVLAMTVDKVRDHFHNKSLEREFNQVQSDDKAGKKLTPDQEEQKRTGKMSSSFATHRQRPEKGYRRALGRVLPVTRIPCRERPPVPQPPHVYALLV